MQTYLFDYEQLTTIPIDNFASTLHNEIINGARLIILQGLRTPDMRKDQIRLLAIMLSDGPLELEPRPLIYLSSLGLISEGYLSCTSKFPSAHMFEREILEEFGFHPLEHPWPKPVRNHQNKNEFFQLRGDEVHEVGVGPVHAGIIEPGHFRFQCHGETVHHLEIMLGYQHRGLLSQIKGGPYLNTLPLMEVAAGDTSIAHSLAYCSILERLSQVKVDEESIYYRLIMLELERLANHVGDLGAMAGDIGFLPSSAFCGRIRGDFLNLSALICGSRLGRGMLKVGGVGFSLNDKEQKEFRTKLEQAFHDTKGAMKVLFEMPSVLARFQHVGLVSTPLAKELGLVGVAARASNLGIDMRAANSFYQKANFKMATHHAGDVYARSYIRYEECKESYRLILSFLDHLCGERRTVTEPVILKPHQLVFSMVEGWRGEVTHLALTDDKGKFLDYKIIDPSFHNWTGLSMALRGQEISDFPLCNKSFNLSYCGFDL